MAVSAPETVRDLRRAQIIAAARAIVCRDGLDALTIGALEQKLAFTRGVITYHFAGKDDIVRAVLESALAEIDEASRAEVESSLSPAEKIAGVLRANVRGFVERPEAGKVLLSFWSRLSADRRIRELNAKLYARYRRRTSALIEEGRRSGELSDVDAQHVATVVVGLVLGIATQWYFEPAAIDVDRAVDTAVAAVLALLGAPGAATRIRPPAAREKRRRTVRRA
ncbi:MAG: TetR/AcrR family transcriptional regulator [Deltaproteobacteria bacterium]|nr:TetR/AcrR family transcriptional regulator [Deltaproteobacteria bacterium]